MEYTGGTTGESKGVMLTNENVNSVIEQLAYSGYSLKRGETWLSVAFPFIAYSLICSQHMPLSLGITANLCFSLDINKVEKQLLKSKCNHMANTPSMWEQLAKSRRLSGNDLSFIIAPTVGADSLEIQKEEEINCFLEKNNCKYKICKGYGMTEVGSAIAATPNNDVNKLGSVGIPLSMTTVGIFDVGTDTELSYGMQGEICIQEPSVMAGYYDNNEAAKDILREHSDGQVWLHSGDLGHMDEEGFLFIDGRIKRMIIDCTGFKIFAPVVESVILEVPYVEKCCVVGAKDTINNVGQIPVAFIVIER
ncbi:MAG: acyl--CoA ligase [Alistipes sp.]|nr:acyl--CoA ligase [Alistipes sp.]